jgi:hypothetical protein
MAYWGCGYVGTMVMEDYLNFVYFFSPLVFADALECMSMPMVTLWRDLRYAVIYFVRGVGIFSGDLNKREEARQAAKKALWDVATALEQHCPCQMLTLNLRLVVVHLHRQEAECGAIWHALEMWIERMIGMLKCEVPECSANPEVTIANHHLLAKAITRCQPFVTDLTTISMKQAQASLPKDNTALPCHLTMYICEGAPTTTHI